MNNKEFISQLAAASGNTSDETRHLIKTLIDRMGQAFTDGDSVQVTGFGLFEVKKRLERVMVNPSTGQRMLIPPKLVLGFKPTQQVKDQLKKGGNA